MSKEQKAIQFLKDYCLYGSSAKYKRNVDVLSKMYKDLELYKKAFELVCGGELAKRILDQARKELNK